MKRTRIGKKENNKWRQVIEADELTLPRNIMVNDKKVKQLKEKRVKFQIVGWKNSWCLAKLVD